MRRDEIATRVLGLVWMVPKVEAAHVEARLHLDVLRAIANGECDNAQACAEEALRTRTAHIPGRLA